MPFRHFYNTRARIRRLGSRADIFAWVSPESDGVLVLNCEESPPALEYGEVVEIHLFGPTVSTVIETQSLGVEGDTMLFTMPASFVRMPGNPSLRIRNRLLTCDLEIDGQFETVKVADISLNGIGFYLRDAIDPENLYRARVQWPCEPLLFNLRFIYSRFYTDKNFWRAGAAIENMSRTDFVRWKRLILEGPIMVPKGTAHFPSSGSNAA